MTIGNPKLLGHSRLRESLGTGASYQLTHDALRIPDAAAASTSDEGQSFIDFQAGSVACLKRPNESENWTLAWAIGPGLLGG